MDNTNGNKKGEDDNRSIVLTIPFTVVGAYPGPGGQYLYLTQFSFEGFEYSITQWEVVIENSQQVNRREETKISDKVFT